ncbi:MAG: ion transporter [Bacteroidales bacterium]|jgi:voltage-gated potassium channel
MKKNLRRKLFEVIFEADTRGGKAFDVSLLIVIVLSIITVMCESVPAFRRSSSELFVTLEWTFTVIFTVEYVLRIYASENKWKYILSFYGLIDLLAILPAFVGFFVVGAHSLLIIRAFRLLRVFRVLKISRYSSAGKILVNALVASRDKIGVFLFTIATIILFIGTLMYLIEGEANGFISIPKSIYWAVVTLTTVGYGDITPQTAIGQFLSGLLMIIGYAIIAVPTGIISLEVARSGKKKMTTQVCPDCMREGHERDSVYCKYCGARLNND